MDTPPTPRERIALVTGAGSGIGRACALALLQDGWTVWLVGRRAQALQACVEHAAAQSPVLGARAHPYTADVGDPAAVDALFAAVRARHGRLDLLFNNAGVFAPAATPDATALEHWHQSVQTNLNGAFYCLRAAFALTGR
jgi:NAD(P)-dependent dehydrogenase (short-subunit alcohol dehydrogenase family)